VRALLPRDAPAAAILAAVEAAANGLAVIDPQELEGLLGSPVPLDTADTGGAPLTPRELEVLRMMADGAANKEIAWKLAISEHTVKFHVASVMGKLNASSRTEAVTRGLRRGLILM
jgi:DNA-binding NarL/FixJ family response regulator